MSEPTARDDARSCTRPTGVRTCYCDRCDLLLGLTGVHVVAVDVTGDGGLRVGWWRRRRRRWAVGTAVCWLVPAAVGR